MKKILLFFISILTVASVFAQDPTVSASSVTFKYCQTTYASEEKSMGTYLLPYTWNYDGTDYTFTTFGSQVITTENERGCDSIVTLTVSLEDGAIPFAFTVNSGGKKVYFSKGNLQYCANPSSGPTTHETRDGENTKGIWRFAENQWSCIRNGNSSCSANYAGWVDMFKFGTSGYKGLMPYTTNKYFQYNSSDYNNSDVGTSKSDYTRTNVDWGWYNAISNGGNVTGRWYCLTKQEWEYVLTGRANASYRRGAAYINGIKGFVLLPDSWSCPDGLSFSTSSANTYTTEQWRLMEQNGAVFLPASGYGYNTQSVVWNSVSYQDNGYYYWTTTRYSNSMNYLYFLKGTYSSAPGLSEYDNEVWKLMSVRLVRNAD